MTTLIGIHTLTIVLSVFIVTKAANPTSASVTGRLSSKQDCPSSGSKQIVYPDDCSKYYQCENGKKEVRSCPESLFFNMEIGSCDFLDNTSCQRLSVAPTKSTKSTTVTTPVPIKTTVNPNSDEDCPASGAKQIPYPSDCSKYYQCHDGYKELKNCPESLFFNVEIESCDFLDNTACQLPTAAPTKPTQTTIVTTPISPKTSELPTAAPTKPTQTTTVVTTSISPKTSVNPNPDQDCPASGTKQIRFPSDCRKYYLCDNGRKELKDCPQSLFFNVQIGSCDFLDNTDCELPTAAPTKPTQTTTVTTPISPKTSERPTAAPTKPTQTTIVTTPRSPKTSERPTAAPTKPTQTTIVTTPLSPKTSEPTQTTTVVTTSISPKTSVNPYPDQDCPASGTKQIGFPGDCSKYYLCDNGRKELKDCPQSLFFNVQIGSCDFLDNTDCVAGSTETSTISTTHISSTPTATTQPTPKPTQSQPTTAAATTPTPTSTPIPRTTKATTRPVTTPTQSQPTTAAVTTTPTLTSNPISPTNEAMTRPAPTPTQSQPTTADTASSTPTPTPDTTKATTPSTPTPTPDTTEATTPSTPAPTPDTTEATTLPSSTPTTSQPTSATTPSTPTPTPDTTEASTLPSSTPTTSQPTSATTPSTPTPTPDTTEATTLPVSTPTSSKPTTAATTLPTPTSTQIPTTTSETEPQYVCTVGSLIQGSVCYGHPEGAFVANPNDCSSFFECIKGNPRKFKCPLGTLWNDSIKKCDVEDNVDC